MKKITLLFCTLFTLALAGTTKAQSFQQGDLVINAGIGLGTTFTWGGGFRIPIGGSVEYGITDQIGVGGEAGFSSGGDLTVFHVGAKGSYHFNQLLSTPDNLDVYAGLGLMYRSFSWSGFGGFGLGSGIIIPLHIGGRYYFSDKFGIHAELGNSYGWLKAGIAIKL